MNNFGTTDMTPAGKGSDLSNAMPKVKKITVQKPAEGSKREESMEKPAFEKIEDAHDETTQIKAGTPRHAALSKLWSAPSKSGGNNIVKRTNTDAVPKATH
jgi:hypothetical protein